MNITHTITNKNGEIIEAISHNEWQQSLEQQKKNEKMHRRGCENNPKCKMCGRKMSDAAFAKARSVHMTTNSDLIPINAKVGDLSQGFFAVGSECAKRLPKGFVRKAGV